jgi:hypothetical protein
MGATIDGEDFVSESPVLIGRYEAKHVSGVRETNA